MSTLSQFFGGEPDNNFAVGMTLVQGSPNTANLSPNINADNAVGDPFFAIRAQIPGFTTADVGTYFQITNGSVLYIQNAYKVKSSTYSNWVRIDRNAVAQFTNLGELDALGIFFKTAGSSSSFTGSASFTSLTKIGRLSIATVQSGSVTFSCFSGASNFTTIDEFYWYDGGSLGALVTIQLTNCALSSSSVSAVLIGLNNGSPTGTSSKTINMSGGTSAGVSSLSAAGAAARTSLIYKGWTVTLNA